MWKISHETRKSPHREILPDSYVVRMCLAVGDVTNQNLSRVNDHSFFI